VTEVLEIMELGFLLSAVRNKEHLSVESQFLTPNSIRQSLLLLSHLNPKFI